MKQPIDVNGRVLDFRLRNFFERYQGELALAVKHVNERFAWRIGSLVDDHGPPAVDAALKDYQIARAIHGGNPSARSTTGRIKA